MNLSVYWAFPWCMNCRRYMRVSDNVVFPFEFAKTTKTVSCQENHHMPTIEEITL